MTIDDMLQELTDDGSIVTISISPNYRSSSLLLSHKRTLVTFYGHDSKQWLQGNKRIPLEQLIHYALMYKRGEDVKDIGYNKQIR